MSAPRATSVLAVLATLSLTAATCQEPKPPPASTAAAKAPPVVAPAPAPADDRVEEALRGIDGLEFDALPAPARRELATVFTDEFCHCECCGAEVLGGCLKRRPECKQARRQAVLAAGEAAAGVPATEIIVALQKYYQSFRAPRADLKVDPRMCKGPADAKVTLVEFSDFECPYCNAARPMLDEVLEARPGVRLCFLPFPLQSHPNAIPAGQAALYARDQGKFWAMHDALFDHQVELGPARIAALGAEVGLSKADLVQALASGKYVAELTAFKDQGRAAKVDATPSLYVNGRKVTLALSKEALVHTLDDELLLGAPQSSGASR